MPNAFEEFLLPNNFFLYSDDCMRVEMQLHSYVRAQTFCVMDPDGSDVWLVSVGQMDPVEVRRN